MDPITISMRALFDQARAEGKWLWTRYHDIWFSPDELEAEQRNGKFRWGSCNWELRDPNEYVNEAKDRLSATQAEYERRVRKVRGIIQ
jgi:hypothetical protein